MDFLSILTGNALLGLGGALVFAFLLELPEIAVGAFGLERDQQEGLFELSRLCIDPKVQEEEYNITSWFVSRCIKRFRKDVNVRNILSYADSNFHSGTIYRACNFTYFVNRTQEGFLLCRWNKAL